MRRASRAHTVLFCVAGAMSGVAAAGEPPPIAHNPFTRPPSEVFSDSRDAPPGDDAPAGSIDLRATLVASNDGLANVAGKVVRPGDEVQGYTLVRIYEDRAVFERHGRQMTVYVKPREAKNND